MIAAGALLIPRQYAVKGLSMEPTLSEGDYLYYTRFRTPGYGDLVVFQQPEYGLMVKRVIGLPGDRISVNADGSVIRNGVPLIEPYIEPDMLGNSAMAETTVEENMLFVLGDNRAVSIDSRDARIGQISAESVLGSVEKSVRLFE
jgi:signal peptidase I